MLLVRLNFMQSQAPNVKAQPQIDSATPNMRVAVVSDTHGLLRESVLPNLEGVSHILHAGDVGHPAILDRLNAIAPTTAIRGNIDRTGPCSLLPETEMLTLRDTNIYMVHSVADLDIEPTAAGIQLVISGHSHKAALDERRGVTYLNPGSIGPRRFSLPITMAMLHLQAGGFRVEFVTLEG